jgi:hypothetical protein
LADAKTDLRKCFHEIDFEIESRKSIDREKESEAARLTEEAEKSPIGGELSRAR